jgi:putative N6-adenine-specific DNA methylase
MGQRLLSKYFPFNVRADFNRNPPGWQYLLHGENECDFYLEAMSSESPLFKRIKRHVIGRERSFFAATPPGFESLCLQELSNLHPAVGEARVLPGGVEFKGRLEDCYRANLNLHLPNRILMRIDTFKSTNFRQLERKVGDIPWELYLYPGSLLTVHVATKHCRLHHSAAISERFQKAITSNLSEIKPAEKPPKSADAEQNIFVRGTDDRFTVSIDSSGDLLYKRGLKKHTGKAPLRETLAAAALRLAGYDGSQPLIDPMCGTGTFSLEGALIAKCIPAGWFRAFAFMGWPSFLSKRWDYIKRQAQTGFVQLEQPMIFASDSDLDACQRLKDGVEKYSLSDAVRVYQKDFFDLAPRELTGQIGVICINPPYGRRLGERHDSREIFHAVCDKLKNDYRGWKLVLIAPSRKLAGTVPFPTEPYPILHGGLKLTLLVGPIK